MTIDRVERTIETTEPVAAGAVSVQTASRHTTVTSPSGAETARRILVLVFGVIQIAIGARILLLLLDAREANGIVSGILSISQWFVGPFEGILRTDSLRAAGSVLDIAAIVAIVGWTVIELLVFGAIRLFRPEPA